MVEEIFYYQDLILEIQNIIDQLPLTTKSNNFTSSEQITNISKDTEFNDSISTSKKYYDIIDDSLILDDVRLCINDMILFITSNFYQTTRSTTSQSPPQLSVSFHDLSLISGNLVYDARDPDEICLIPLGKGPKLVSARDFYDQLCRDAEHERKLKKRNQLSGLHKLVETFFIPKHNLFF